MKLNILCITVLIHMQCNKKNNINVFGTVANIKSESSQKS